MGKSSITLQSLAERVEELEKKLAHEPFDIDKKCPQCLTTKISLKPHHAGEQRQIIARGGVMRSFKCDECGFEWSFMTTQRSSPG